MSSSVYPFVFILMFLKPDFWNGVSHALLIWAIPVFIKLHSMALTWLYLDFDLSVCVWACSIRILKSISFVVK